MRAVLLAAAAGDAAHFPGLVGKLACALDVFRGLGGQEPTACRPRPLDVSGVISALSPSDVEKALKFITSFAETLRTTTGSAANASLVSARFDPAKPPASSPGDEAQQTRGSVASANALVSVPAPALAAVPAPALVSVPAPALAAVPAPALVSVPASPPASRAAAPIRNQDANLRAVANPEARSVSGGSPERASARWKAVLCVVLLVQAARVGVQIAKVERGEAVDLPFIARDFAATVGSVWILRVAGGLDDEATVAALGAVLGSWFASAAFWLSCLLAGLRPGRLTSVGAIVLFAGAPLLS